MWHDVAEASILVVVGMAVVFAALAILMVAIMILNRLAPEKAQKAVAPVELSGAEASEKQRVAAIAVALALAKEQSGEGETGETARPVEASRWAIAGRERVMRSREKAGRR
jgi:Na+-transporting methylmalonyl-CoA/oxaloacetate decarboxylase gamma subunit